MDDNKSIQRLPLKFEEMNEEEVKVQSFEMNVLRFNHADNSSPSPASSYGSLDENLASFLTVDLKQTKSSSDSGTNFQTPTPTDSISTGQLEKSSSDWEVLDDQAENYETEKMGNEYDDKFEMKKAQNITFALQRENEINISTASGKLIPSHGKGTVFEINGNVLFEFSKEEVSVFQNYFDIADYGADGIIDLEEGMHFLRRSEVPEDTLLRDWKSVQKLTRSASHFTKGAWFLICKLVALEQQSSGSVDINALLTLASTAPVLLPLPEFNLLGRSRYSRHHSADKFYLNVKILGNKMVNNHTEYKIRTQTNLSTYFKQEVTVWRRFRHFEWLDMALHRHFSGRILPALPDKRWFGSKREEYIAKRETSLFNYLKTLTNHPVICGSFTLQSFLEGSPRYFKAAQSILHQRKSPDKGISGQLTNPEHLLCCTTLCGGQQLNTTLPTADIAEENNPNEIGGEMPQKKQLNKLKNFIYRFHPDITKMENVYMEISKIYSEQVQQINQVGNALAEAEYHDHINRQRVEIAFGRTANILEDCLKSYKANLDGIVQQRGFANSMIHSLKNRDVQENSYKSAHQAKEACYNRMRKKGTIEPSSPEFHRLQGCILNSERQQHLSVAEAGTIESNLWEDFSWFLTQQRYLMEGFVKNYLDTQVKQAEDMRNAWTSMLQEMKFSEEEMNESTKRVKDLHGSFEMARECMTFPSQQSNSVKIVHQNPCSPNSTGRDRKDSYSTLEKEAFEGLKRIL